jgi:TonB family protein
VFVHVGAIGLAALLLVLVGPPARSASGGRRRPTVDLAYLARIDDTPRAPPQAATPEVPGTLRTGDDPPTAELLIDPGLVPPVDRAPGDARSAASPAPAPRTTRSWTGTPARTVVVTTMPEGELTAGGAAGAGDIPAPGDKGGEPASAGPSVLALGPPGSPTTVSLGSLDPRFSDYLGTVASLLEPEWRNAFPRERALFMQQGEVVIAWTVERDGSIGRVSLVRPSGVPPFDNNVLAGFRRAAMHFPPPPDEMPLPVRILAPYRFDNPMFD